MPRPLYLARIDPRTRPDPPADPRPTRHRGQGIGGGAVRGDGRGFVFAVRLIVAVFLTVTERLRRFAPPPIPPGSARPPLLGRGRQGGRGQGTAPRPRRAEQWKRVDDRRQFARPFLLRRVLGLGGLALARTLARRAILAIAAFHLDQAFGRTHPVFCDT